MALLDHRGNSPIRHQGPIRGAPNLWGRPRPTKGAAQQNRTSVFLRCDECDAGRMLALRRRVRAAQSRVLADVKSRLMVFVTNVS
jgi:hypothetical protein